MLGNFEIMVKGGGFLSALCPLLDRGSWIYTAHPDMAHLVNIAQPTQNANSKSTHVRDSARNEKQRGKQLADTPCVMYE